MSQEVPDWYSLDEGEEVLDGRHRHILPYLTRIISGIVGGPILAFLIGSLYYDTNQLAAIAVGGLIVLGGIVYSIYEYLLYKATYYLVTSDHLAKKEWLFGHRSDPLHHSDVVDTSIEQTFIEDLLGMGTIKVFSAGGTDSVDIEMRHVPNPQEFHNLIKEQKNNYNPESNGTQSRYPDQN